LEAPSSAAVRRFGRDQAKWHCADLRIEREATASGQRLAPGLRSVLARELGQAQALRRGGIMRTTVASDAIVQEITIKASAERIFEALTNPDQRVKWWGSEGRFQTTHMESDLRPGGRWVMRGIGMGGRPFSVVGEYRSIERPRLLVFTWLPDWQGGCDREPRALRPGRGERCYNRPLDAFRPR